MSGVLPADLQAAAALGGEMGQRLRAFDWSEHPLGDPVNWSPATRATVANALTSRFPIVLWLGERLRLIYNDAYMPVLGDKHPEALGAAGSDVWWDIWDVIGPMLESVVKSGMATWSDDLRLLLANAGRRSERYFTFTYSPVVGADSKIEGVFCAVAETTERVLGERRLQALNALAAALMGTQSVDDALAAVIEVCAAHDADLPFAAIYLADRSLRAARLHRATANVAGHLPGSLSWFLDEQSVQQDGLRLAGNLPARPVLADRLTESCPEQALVVPLAVVTEGSPMGALVLGLNRYRPLDDQYRGFCRLVADQVSAALANVRAYEEERRRAEALAQLDRAKTTFLTNVSHEFRTPLTLMLGPLEDAISAVPGDSGLAEVLATVKRNGQRLLRLVNSLLDFSRIQAGHSRPQLVAADLGALTAGIGVEDRGDLDPAPPARRPAAASDAPPESDLGRPGTARGPAWLRSANPTVGWVAQSSFPEKRDHDAVRDAALNTARQGRVQPGRANPRRRGRRRPHRPVAHRQRAANRHPGRRQRGLVGGWVSSTWRSKVTASRRAQTADRHRCCGRGPVTGTATAAQLV